MYVFVGWRGAIRRKETYAAHVRRQLLEAP